MVVVSSRGGQGGGGTANHGHGGVLRSDCCYPHKKTKKECRPTGSVAVAVATTKSNWLVVVAAIILILVVVSAAQLQQLYYYSSTTVATTSNIYSSHPNNSEEESTAATAAAAAAAAATAPADATSTANISSISNGNSNNEPSLRTTEADDSSVVTTSSAKLLPSSSSSSSYYASSSSSLEPEPPVVHQQYQLFHMIWTKGNITFGQSSYTPQMALETICFHHKRRHRSSTRTTPTMIQINLFIMDTVHVDERLIEQLNNGGCNIQIQILPRPWTTYFEGTPLEHFTSSHSQLIEQGPYFYSHLTDLFRLAVLWKHGGWFVDSDVAWVRPVIVNIGEQENGNGDSGTTTATVTRSSSKSTSIFKNALADEGPVYNNCISTFTKHHPFLKSVVDHISDNYNSTHYITCIESLTSVTKEWQNKCHHQTQTTTTTTTTTTDTNIQLQGHHDSNGNDDDDDDDDDECVTILHRTTFFPIGSPKRCRLLFDKSTPTIDHKIFGNNDERRNYINNNNNKFKSGNNVVDDNTTTATVVTTTRTRNIQKQQRQLPYAVHYFGSKNLHKMMHPNSTLYKVYRRGCIICNLPTSTSTSTST